MKIRLAQETDLEAVEALMKHSMQLLGQGHYTEAQVSSCCHHVCVPPRQLIKDQTFFVVTTGDEALVGCGGWSFRKTLYAGPAGSPQEDSTLDPKHEPARIRAMFTAPQESGKGIGSLILAHSERAAQAFGFQRGMLGATLSGVAFYKSKGWRPMTKEQATLPDGVTIGVIQMEKDFYRL